MRISHTELEACRRNPVAWVSVHFTAGASQRTFGYNQAVKFAIFKYHATNDEGDAKTYLASKLKRFADATRIEHCKAVLSAYIGWAKKSGVIVADCKVRLSLPLQSDVVLGGEISRVDVDPADDVYRAILIGPSTPPGWKNELRIPLIQHEIANKYARPVNNVEVGFQELDGSGLRTARFTRSEIDNALKEAQSLSTAVERAVTRLRGR